MTHADHKPDFDVTCAECRDIQLRWYYHQINGADPLRPPETDEEPWAVPHEPPAPALPTRLRMLFVPIIVQVLVLAVWRWWRRR